MTEKFLTEQALKELYDRADSVAKDIFPHSVSHDLSRVSLVSALINAQAADKTAKAIEKMTEMLSEKRFYNSFGT